MTKRNKKKIAIVGAGIFGLATAALFAKDSYKVDVLEKLILVHRAWCF